MTAPTLQEVVELLDNQVQVAPNGVAVVKASKVAKLLKKNGVLDSTRKNMRFCIKENKEVKP